MNNPPSPTSTERKALAERLHWISKDVSGPLNHAQRVMLTEAADLLEHIPDPVGSVAILNALRKYHPAVEADWPIAIDIVAAAAPQSAGVSENDSEMEQPRIADGGQCNEQQPHAPSLELNISKEWCLRMAELEGDSEIGAGFETCPTQRIYPMTDDQIKHMVDRFLSWKLPEHFNPDCGINFDANAAIKLNPRNHKFEPIGTNLFSATQADAMVRHMLEGLPANAETRRNDSGECPPPAVFADPIPSPVSDRTAWLCEMNGAAVNYAKINPDDYDEHWTDKVDDALQFARKIDAENYIAHYGWTHVKAVEHMWCEPRPAAPVSEAEVIERCAKVAESVAFDAWVAEATAPKWLFPTDSMKRAIASAIRALSTSIEK